ncbi:MAG TPA: hypothetical protein VME21_06350 [Steroidobacteraceae bacterium]|nr:hypothetical protein [Steroidobacteraceae bacterium]
MDEPLVVPAGGVLLVLELSGAPPGAVLGGGVVVSALEDVLVVVSVELPGPLDC